MTDQTRGKEPLSFDTGRVLIRVKNKKHIEAKVIPVQE